MADGGEDSEKENTNPYSFHSFTKSKRDEENPGDSLEIPEAEERPSEFVAGERREKVTVAQKREENPFSFKQFLKNDASISHRNLSNLPPASSSNTGARPKMRSQQPSSSDIRLSPPAQVPQQNEASLSFENHTPRRSVTNRASLGQVTALPDFVQDHIAIEQSLASLNGDGYSRPTVDLDSLPDFAVDGHPTQDSERQSGELPDLPRSLRSSVPDSVPQPLLNLPDFGDSNVGVVKIPLDLTDRENLHVNQEEEGLPFDLPSVVDVSSPHRDNNPNINGSGGENVVPNSLPDFLSDGPMHSGHYNEDSQDITDERLAALTIGDVVDENLLQEIRRMREENHRLQRLLEEARSHLQHETTRSQSLQSELVMQQQRETDETSSLEKVIEQVEKNLDITTQRALRAETTVTKLKQEVRNLQGQVKSLNEENMYLSQTSHRGHPSNNRPRVNEAAQDLRAAARNAEELVRKFSKGIEGLHLIAASLENSDRISEEDASFCDSASGAAKS